SHRVLSARFRRRGGQRGEVRRRGSSQSPVIDGSHDIRVSLAGRAGGPRATRMTLDPIHQFNIDNLFTIGHIGGQPIYFTNSSAYMLVTVAVICLLAVRGFKGRQLVPGRFQSMAELSYEFVATMVRSNAGQEGMKFFPLVYSLFMFILVSNLIGIIPYTFTVAAQIIVTASFALLVFFTVLVYGFYKNGLKFFKIFVPSGIPIYIL